MSVFEGRVAAALGVALASLRARVVIVKTLGAAAIPARVLSLAPALQATELAVTPNLSACAIIGPHSRGTIPLSLTLAATLGETILRGVNPHPGVCFGRGSPGHVPPEGYFRLILRAACIEHAGGYVPARPKQTG
jgi:hypothetical protein